MRALAEFIMRGRLQASLVALVGNLVPLISPATVGLVSLRRNYQDSLLVLLCAAIPLVLTLYAGTASYLIVLTSLTTLVAVLVAAEVLKGTVSWQLTLLAILGLCSAAILVAGTLMPGETERVTSEVQSVMNNLESRESQPASPFHVLMAITALNLAIEKTTQGFVLGFLSWLTVIHVTGSLLLSRWWQALLYNPGGFRQEFHNLRFNSLLASGLMMAVAALHLMSPVLMPWASMMGFPLLLAGIGIVHHTVNAFGLGVFWLILFYAGLIFFGPLSLVLVGVGFLDSFLDFRTRIAKMRQ